MTRWIEPQSTTVPSALRAVLPIPGSLGDLVASLLVRRGITDPEQARGFLEPDAYSPASPDDLPDLLPAVDRIARAIDEKEWIAIWGDFDVDGQTATALYLQALTDLGARVRFQIPTRRQSHGMHPAGVQRLIDEGTDLILTADTGIDAYTAIDLAAERGVDTVVTDHHDLTPSLPHAFALVNPKRLSAAHPLAELPGVGVAYQVTRALYRRLGRSAGARFLDLVALGIVADVATLRADVRYLLQRGLSVLRNTERIGLQAVIKLANIEPELLAEDNIRFALAPRLNAISRVGQDHEGRSAAADGVELLTTDDPVRAQEIAVNIEGLNARRRWMTMETIDAALSQLERNRELQQGPAIVVSGPAWDPGIVGIVAGQLAARFGRPAIVFSSASGETARGSARSVEGIDIHAAIAAQEPMLHRCGGHPMAAGLSLDSERIDEFRRALWRTLEQGDQVPVEPAVEVDAYLALDQLSLRAVRAIHTLSPFGSGNEAPVFATKNVRVVRSSIVGRTREHRRLLVRDDQGRQESVFWWRSADLPVPEGTFDLAYTVAVNVYRGQENVQLTWVEARGAERAPAVTLTKPAIEVHDSRQLSDKEERLRALIAEQRAGRSIVLWGEPVRHTDAPVVDRTRLLQAETLVVWTAPPGPGAFRRTLEMVSPQTVELLAVEPGLDTEQRFLERLAGLVNHVLHRRSGSVELVSLAAAMAHNTWTVRLGLDWLHEKGKIRPKYEPGGWVTIGQGDETTGDRLAFVAGQLQAQLLETAAYRRFFSSADAHRLVNE